MIADPRALIRQHMALECIGINAQGNLMRIPGPDPDDLPRVYAMRYAGGASLHLGLGLSASVRASLEALPLDRFYDEPELIAACLLPDAPCASVHCGSSYIFPGVSKLQPFGDAVLLNASHASLVAAFDPDVILAGRAIYGVIVEGRLASVCMSSREDMRSAEAWVYTRVDCRGWGYAAQATWAWARGIVALGKRPFYSHRAENAASAAVARRLGLIRYVDEAVYL